MIADIIAGFITGLYNVIEIVLNKGRLKETVREHIVKNEFIHKRLYNLLHDINANRLSIKQYHNGGYYFTGLPMQRYSTTYEAVSEGISTELTNNQNKLVSENPTLHSAVIKDGDYFIPDTEKLDDPSFKQKLLKTGVKSFYSLGIWDIKDNLVGLISAEYVLNKHEVTDKDKEEIDDFSKLIAGYLIQQTAAKSQNVISVTFIFIMGLIILLSQVVFLCTTVYSVFKYFVH